MVATTRRKTVGLGILTAVIGVAIALPFALIHPVLPFTVVLLGFGAIILLQRWRWVPKHSMGYLLGCLVALVALLPAVSLFKFAERGFDDGPFYGVAYDGVITGESASDRMDYRDGELLIYNRPADKAPILAYRVEEDVEWAREMDIGQNSRYEKYRLESIEEPELAYGIFRDRLDFEANWNFGTEAGRAYLWKWGGFHRFFLSW
ncbi:hypothetical protein PN498_08240 [Oscillatoria sp. CS-180]|uniref:hypothetical protein n=1 Tax=Oscillatoria sp. CS-180 TaxID=3021720 RepID=UPI0023313589|nr:hypothetical protein [Oscillatoria sp. CS-180]MDB9525972.1 hypothetical protein [Oscillatoria sp. CS-180]